MKRIWNFPDVPSALGKGIPSKISNGGCAFFSSGASSKINFNLKNQQQKPENFKYFRTKFGNNLQCKPAPHPKKYILNISLSLNEIAPFFEVGLLATYG